MRPIERFNLKPVPGRPGEALLTGAGLSAGLTVPGERLAAQYALSDDDVLLVTDENSPYEEQVHFVLIGRGRIVDAIAYGAPYTPGIFVEVDRHRDRLRFRFAGEHVMVLRVLERPTRRLSAGAAGARYSGGVLARLRPHRLILSHGRAE